MTSSRRSSVLLPVCEAFEPRMHFEATPAAEIVEETLPATLSPGLRFSVDLTVQDSPSVASRAALTLVASADTTPSDDDVVLGQGSVRFRGGGLAAVRQRASVPASAPPGAYYLIASLDLGGGREPVVARSAGPLDLIWRFGGSGPLKAIDPEGGSGFQISAGRGASGTVTPREDGLHVAVQSPGPDGSVKISGARDGAPRFRAVSVAGPLAKLQTTGSVTIDRLVGTGDIGAVQVGRLTEALALPGISRLSITGDLARAKIVVGASLGADGRPGGAGDAADTFRPAYVGSIDLKGAVTESVIAVGVDVWPADGAGQSFTFLDPGAAAIGKLSVGGGMDEATRVAAATVPATVRLGRAKVPSVDDARFFKQADADEFPLADPCSDGSPHKRLLDERRYPQRVYDRLEELGAELQPLGDQSLINFSTPYANYDHYEITIPAGLLGFDFDTKRFLQEWSMDMNLVTEGEGEARFNFVNLFAKLPKPAEVGDVIGINILGPDDADVMVTEVTDSRFTVATIGGYTNGDHPVSGSREFGLTRNEDDSVTFYTRGIDSPYNTASQSYGVAPALQSSGWSGLIQGIGEYFKMTPADANFHRQGNYKPLWSKPECHFPPTGFGSNPEGGTGGSGTPVGGGGTNPGGGGTDPGGGGTDPGGGGTNPGDGGTDPGDGGTDPGDGGTDPGGGGTDPGGGGTDPGEEPNSEPERPTTVPHPSQGIFDARITMEANVFGQTMVREYTGTVEVLRIGAATRVSMHIDGQVAPAPDYVPLGDFPLWDGTPASSSMTTASGALRTLSSEGPHDRRVLRLVMPMSEGSGTMTITWMD